MYVYGRLFEILLSPTRPSSAVSDLNAHDHSVYSNLSLEQEFTGGIILRPEASRKLYYIFPNATRYRFAGKEEVAAVNLATERIYGDVPFEIITVFPPVHARHDE